MATTKKFDKQPALHSMNFSSKEVKEALLDYLAKIGTKIPNGSCQLLADYGELHAITLTITEH